MFPIFPWVLGLIFTALVVEAQSATQWCDNLTNICFTRYYLQSLDTGFGYVFPPLQPPSNEFIGIYTAPVSAGWIGNSLGGGMRSNPLIIGWIDESKPVVSARFVSSYTPPVPLAGPVLTVLGTSGVNATHQRIVYRCQNCTSWTGGSGGIVLNGTSTFGYATHGSVKPDTPSDPNSNLLQHTAVGQHGIDVSAAHTDQYAAYLQQLLTAGPITPPTTPTTTTTTTAPTPTGPLVCPGAPAPTYSMVVASGYRVTPVLGRLTTPRGIAIDTMGHLLVVQTGVGISAHTLDANGCVTSSKTIISDTSLNHGIDITATKIYASSSDIAWSWDYNPATMTATNRKTLVTGMYNIGHPTRTLLVSRKYPDYLVVSVGSNSNIDLPSFDPAAGRASVKVFDLRTVPVNGYSYPYGLRNDVGLAEDNAGIIHSVENSMDDAYRTINGQTKDVHNDNPAEKVYKLGNPTSPTALFGGYPYCFTVWEPSNFVDKQFTAGDWFVQAPNTTLTDAWCGSNAVKPTVLLPPHTAPLDMKFGLGSDTNLYVGLHGSWDRNPPQGYKVVVVPGKVSASGEWSPSAASLAATKANYVDLLKNVDETKCQSGCFRPVGLVWSPNGENLYVSSDASGEVFLLKRNGGPIVTTTTASTSTSITTSTTSTSTTTIITTTTSTTTSTAPQPTQTLWGQCAGNGYTGPKKCPPNSTCRYQNDWYSQCIPA
ncbi:hypothetical protein BDQ12DRAFT_701066 [Crucibulum laeve]|uniref:CBM1 domain-containing protein n=1 Tax=Crucibulum laeve TaxID=68775 RepID=A0A5C3LIX4_9AGAR|nr:hypothetical protein BDQ12DRAFT_701066 [Crucibulum laeve]